MQYDLPKYPCFLLYLLSMPIIAQDLPTVYAYGGEGRNVNWSAIKAEHYLYV